MINLQAGLSIGEVHVKPPNHAGDGTAEPILTVV
jgi:hypothetical protein